MEQEEASREDLKMFMAFAPAEPQPWFKPEMPPKPEPMPAFLPAHWTREMTEQYHGLGDYQDEVKAHPETIAYRNRRDETIRLTMLWEEVYTREKYIQWPRAWATAVIRTIPRR